MQEISIFLIYNCKTFFLVFILIDTKIEEAGVGASLAVQCVAALGTVVAVRVQHVAPLQKAGDLQLVID